MSFHELLDGLLTELQVPFYEGQPEFDGTPPEQFVSYHIRDVPALRGCGRECYTAYYVTLNIYTTGAHKHINSSYTEHNLTALLLDNGFIRQGGSFGLSNDFSRYYHRITEFYYIMKG